MTNRELVVLGTASQVPTRHRNHNGYLLRWDGEGLLFDPGEGTQRQMLLAGVSATDLNRVLVTHFHGDHSLGLAGVIQRINLDRVPHPVHVHYPAGGQQYFDRLRYATAYHETAQLLPSPVHGSGVLAEGTGFRLKAVALSHPVDSYGYQLVEPDQRRMRPEKLAEFGLGGRIVGELQRQAVVELNGRRITLAEVSEVYRGQRFAFVMDTRMCQGVEELADGADLLVIESTFLESERALADEHGHLTAAQAARAAQAAGVRTLVLTHFSQRYPDLAGHEAEAREHFEGELVVARDLARIPVPPRQRAG
ncbi:ribonuclease Z [Streptomyces tateyamensis]|uniref:Ribonuclease Z n=1 Tax=Streptomyces tateyamensis TaxID=565073 RepID=A0A2V4NU38_9ACTN|nr:ribonuclease Z [Streptomyces tateyamensis]PYC68012.1 ribonuclease Z [Streptomyces tateyamensis]